jgi:small conductance mechanosensitive channel
VFRATSFAFAHLPATLSGSCGSDPGIACRLTWDFSHSTDAAQVVRTYLAGPASQVGRILFIVILALVVRSVLLRLLVRIFERAATVTLPSTPAGRTHKAAAAAAHAAGLERRTQRARALGSILRSAVSAVVVGIASLTILGILGFDLAPLLASTTVLGVALGFGAQNLVRDYLSGILMLTEDHYGVGDTINAGPATGTVEAMSLLTTRVRDVNGVVWHIRNGTIEAVGNESQGWSRAVIDYPIAYGEDLGRIRRLMEQAAASLYRERTWRKVMLEKPEVWGAQELSSKEVTMRIVAKTTPMRQSEVGRELRARVKMVLDAAGVASAGPDTIVVTAPSEGGSAGSPARDGATATGEAGAVPEAGATDETAAEVDEAQTRDEDEDFGDEDLADENLADEALARDREKAWSGRP